MDDASRILPTLFIGRAPATPADVAGLKRRGISAVLSLLTDDDLAALGLSWIRLQEWYRAAGIEAHRLPIEDWSAQALIARLDEAVQALDRLLAVGHTVYLHCTAGVNRSPSVALGYLRKVEEGTAGPGAAPDHPQQRLARSRCPAGPLTQPR